MQGRRGRAWQVAAGMVDTAPALPVRVLLLLLSVALACCALLPVTPVAAAGCEVQEIFVPMTVYDQQSGYVTGKRHPDFQRSRYPTSTKNMLKEKLDKLNKPVLRSTGSDLIPYTILSETSWHSWFHEVGGTSQYANRVVDYSIRFRRTAPGSRKFVTSVPGTTSQGTNFFPVDHKGFKDHYRNGHNYAFSTELHTKFRFRGDGRETFYFRGDDDLWMFLGGVLIVDLGGLHPPEQASITLKECKRPGEEQKNTLGQRTSLCLKKGEIYTMSVFHAERHTTGSTYYFETTFDIVPELQVQNALPITLFREDSYVNIEVRLTQQPDAGFTLQCYAADSGRLAFTGRAISACSTTKVWTVRATYVASDIDGTLVTCKAVGNSIGIYQGVETEPFLIITKSRTKPTINLPSYPADACTAPAAQTPTTSDYCGGNVEVAVSARNANTRCVNQFDRIFTYTARDQCGQTTTATQTVRVHDGEAPVISVAGYRASQTVPCTAVPAPGAATAQDRCSGSVPVSLRTTRRDGACPSRYTLTHEWSAKDACDNTATKASTVIVTDTAGPTFPGAPAAELAATCANVPSAPTRLVARDACGWTGHSSPMVATEVSRRCKAEYVVKRTWQAADPCGNQATHTSTVHVSEGVAPSFANPPATSVVAECKAPSPVTPAASAVCGQDVSVSVSTQPSAGNCPHRATVKHTWTARSECGLTATASQTINVVDNTAPQFVSPPGHADVQCNAVPAMVAPVAEDNCDESPAVTSQEIRVDGACPDTYTLFRVFRTNDACANSRAHLQRIQVADTTPPTITLGGVPEPATQLPATKAECDNVPAAEAAVASDNCASEAEVAFSETRTRGACAHAYTVTRRWDSVDRCGNAAPSVTRVVEVSDSRAPAFVAFPADVTVECSDVPATAQIGVDVRVEDNCSTATTVRYVGEARTDGACANAYVLKRTWEAVDECNNSARRTQTITVRDTGAPTLETPAEGTALTVQCGNVPARRTLAASDACAGAVAVTSSDQRSAASPTCSNEATLSRQWVARDVCGNEATVRQTIAVVDRVGPAFSATPQSMTIPISQKLPDADELTAADVCDGGTAAVTFAQTTEQSSCSGVTTVRTWVTRDSCNNEVQHVQRITQTDDERLEFRGLPASSGVEVSCEAVPARADVSAVKPLSGNAATVVASTTEVAGRCANARTITHSYTASDSCGNSLSASYDVVVTDTTKPALRGVPADVAASCDAVPAAPDAVSASDNCRDDLVRMTTSETRQAGACTHSYSLVRQFAASDACGNEASEQYVVTVTDAAAPTLTGVPADVAVACDAVPVASEVSAADTCAGARPVVLAEKRSDGSCPHTYVLKRTWSAEDECSNRASKTQTIDVRDSVAPAFVNFPGDVEVFCAAVPEDLDDVAAADTCDDDVSVEKSTTKVPGSCANQYTIKRAFAAEDKCGNRAERVHKITVQDEGNAPVFDNAPLDATVECDDVPSIPSDVTASDPCGGGHVTVTVEERRVDGACEFDYVLERTFTATDVCGRTSTHVQLVTVADSIAPTLVDELANQDVGCFGDIQVTTPRVRDNCAAAANVTAVLSEETGPGSCPNDWVATRRWSVSDSCGNIRVATQQVRMEDATPPDMPESQQPVEEVTKAYGEETLSWLAVSAQLEGMDYCPNSLACQGAGRKACSIPIYATADDVRVDGACPHTFDVQRTWTVADGCENGRSFTQTVHVVDDEAPTFAGVPFDETHSCAGTVLPVDEIEAPVATDNSGEVTVTFSEEAQPLREGAALCANGRRLVRTWLATDPCGNTATAIQTITIEDTAPPALRGVPADFRRPCDRPDEAPKDASSEALEAWDNCDGAVVVHRDEERVDGRCAHEYTLRTTFAAVDSCGNRAEGTQDIAVFDTQPPVLAGTPDSAEVSVSCGGSFPSTPTLTGQDACSGSVEVAYTVEEVEGCASLSAERRRWRAVDGCGNEAVFTQLVREENFTPPTIAGVPADTTAESGSVPEASTAGMHATDACSGEEIEVEVEESRQEGSCADAFTLFRTFSARDACGNFGYKTQRISVGDTQAPQFDVPELKDFYTCGEQLPGEATLLGGSAGVEVTRREQRQEGSCPGNYTIMRSYSAVDSCGNEGGVFMNIRVGDASPPTFTNPPVAELPGVHQCAPPAPAATIKAEDECEGHEVTVTTDVSFLSGDHCDQWTALRTFIAEDECGNQAYATQRVQLADAPPTFVESTLPPADQRVYGCGDVPEPAAVRAADDCSGDGDLAVHFSEELDVDPNGCGATLSRHWVANDTCHHGIEHVQRLKLKDTTAPDIDVTALKRNVRVDCVDVLKDGLPAVASLTALDTCPGIFGAATAGSSVVVKLQTEEVAGNLTRCDANTVVTRTYVATDFCGNSATVKQVITVRRDAPRRFVNALTFPLSVSELQARLPALLEALRKLFAPHEVRLIDLVEAGRRGRERRADGDSAMLIFFVRDADSGEQVALSEVEDEVASARGREAIMESTGVTITGLTRVEVEDEAIEGARADELNGEGDGDAGTGGKGAGGKGGGGDSGGGTSAAAIAVPVVLVLLIAVAGGAYYVHRKNHQSNAPPDLLGNAGVETRSGRTITYKMPQKGAAPPASGAVAHKVAGADLSDMEMRPRLKSAAESIRDGETPHEEFDSTFSNLIAKGEEADLGGFVDNETHANTDEETD